MPISELQPGQPVTWISTPRGGYGYGRNVPAFVLRIGAKVAIACLTESGEWKPRYVKPTSLSPRELKSQPLD